jgi:tetratricopeptide (TPR) repeat protein
MSWDEWQQANSRADTPYAPTCVGQPTHPSLVEHARELAGAGDQDRAEALLRKAVALEPDGAINVEAELRGATAAGMLKRVSILTLYKKYDEAVNLYDEAHALDPEAALDEHTVYGLCSGAPSGAAVLPFCDKAVALNPGFAMYRYYRGIARAVAQDLAGAAEDLEQFAAMSEPGWEEQVAQAPAWVEALRRGENPFTEEVLAQLRKQP